MITIKTNCPLCNKILIKDNQGSHCVCGKAHYQCYYDFVNNQIKTEIIRFKIYIVEYYYGARYRRFHAISIDIANRNNFEANSFTISKENFKYFKSDEEIQNFLLLS